MPKLRYAYTPSIDAGVASPVAQEEFRIKHEDWVLANSEELSWITSLLLHTNQRVSMQEEIFSGDVIFRILYKTPCITALKGA